MDSFLEILPFIMIAILVILCVMYIIILEVNNRSKYISEHMDAVTGLKKHTAFLKDVKKELSDNPTDKYAMVYINITDFDDIIKVLDLEEYEVVLRIFSDMLVRVFGEENIHGKLDGANFESLVKYTNIAEVPTFLEALRCCLKNKSGIMGNQLALNLQVGIYLIDSEQTRIPAEEMCQCASVALKNIMSKSLGYSFFRNSMLRGS